MSATGSVSRWYQQLRAGDEAGAAELWERFFRRLAALARQRLGHAPRGVRDEEDIVLSAFDSFCQGTRAGQFPEKLDRDRLWRLLATITTRKVCDQLAYQQQQCRDASRVTADDELLLSLAAPEPAPEVVAEFAELLDRLMTELPNDEYRQIAVLKLEGHTDPEIAAKLGRGRATVARKLAAIRALWEDWP